MIETANRSLTPVADECGPFRRIADAFRTPGGTWVGAVVASPLAMYLLKAREQVLADLNPVRVARLVGSDQMDAMRTCIVGELPKPIRQVLDPWDDEPNRDVIVLPRLAVSRVKWVNWAWSDARVKITCGGDEFSFDHATLDRPNKQFMLDNGWILNTDLRPTTAPIHGSFIVLPAGAPPRRRPLARRIWYVALFLLFVAFLLSISFVIPMLMRHH